MSCCRYKDRRDVLRSQVNAANFDAVSDILRNGSELATMAAAAPTQDDVGEEVWVDGLGRGTLRYEHMLSFELYLT